MQQRSALLTDRQEKMILTNFNLRKIKIRQTILPSNTTLIIISNLYRDTKLLTVSEVISDIEVLRTFLVKKLGLNVNFLIAKDNDKAECEIIITLK
jgi:hypothetical protein